MFKFFVLLTLISFQHHHLTMTSLNYVPDSDSIRVFVRVDYNSFLKDYQQTVNDDIDLEQLRKYVSFPHEEAGKYINSKLSLYADGRLLKSKLLLIEISDGSVSLDVVYHLNRKLKNMTVRNTFLTGLYSDAENLTIIKTGNFEKGIRFTREYTEETFRVK